MGLFVQAHEAASAERLVVFVTLVRATSKILLAERAVEVLRVIFLVSNRHALASENGLATLDAVEAHRIVEVFLAVRRAVWRWEELSVFKWLFARSAHCKHSAHSAHSAHNARA